MGKLPVLNVITRLEQGGAPLALIETARRMDPDKFGVTIACGMSEDPELELMGTDAARGLAIVPVPSMRRTVDPLRDLVSLAQLLRAIRRGRYRIVHTHTSKAGILGRLAATLCGVPAVVHSPHGTILEGYFGPRLTRFFTYWERLAARWSDQIICLTQKEIEQYLAARIGIRRQYTYVYNGIDIARFEQEVGDRQAIRRSLGVSDDDVACISIGRLVPIKGHTDLLEAFAKVLSGCPSAVLLLAGEGELRKDLEDQAQRSGIAGRVKFLGWRQDTPALLEASDLFILASHNEGLGLVLIEAMVKHLPILATRVGGVPEVVSDGETGLLVPPRDPVAMARAAVRLASDPGLRRRMGNAGHIRATQLFSIESTVRNTERIYAELAGASA